MTSTLLLIVKYHLTNMLLHIYMLHTHIQYDTHIMLELVLANSQILTSYLLENHIAL